LQINGQTLELGNSATFTGATNQILATSAQIVYNVVAAQKHNFAVGGSGKAEISATGLFLSGSGELLNLGASGPLGSSISSSYNTISGRSTGLEITSATGLPIKFFVYTNEYERINSGGLHEAYQLSLGGTIGSGVDPGRGGISLTNRLQFSGAGTADSTKSLIYTDAANGNMSITAPTGKAIQFLIAGGQKAYLDSSGLVAAFHLNIMQNIMWAGAGNASSALTTMWADAAAGNLFSNVPTAKYEQHRVAGSGLLSLGRASSTHVDSAWAIGGYAANGTLSAASTGIYGIGTSMIFNVPSGNAYYLDFADTSKYRFAAALCEFDRLSLGGTIGSSVDPGAGGISITGGLKFSGAGTSSATTSQIYGGSSNGDINYNVSNTLAYSHNFRIGGFTTYSFGYSTTLGTASANTFQLGDGSGAYFLSDGFGTIHNVANTYTHKMRFAGTEKYRFSAALCEFDRLSLGGTIGSSSDPGAGGINASGNITSSNNSNVGGRVANFSAQRYFNNYFWGWPASAYLSSMGSFNGSGYPFICFYGYHSTTTNTIARSSATNAPVWMQSNGGALEFYTGSSGTADVDCAGTARVKIDPVGLKVNNVLETERLSVGTFAGGSNPDPGANGIACAGNIFANNNSNVGGRVANISAQKYYNNFFWGWPASAYLSSMGSFNGSGIPFVCFYGYHSTTTNTIARASATNAPVWMQSSGGAIEFFTGSSGTADGDCTGTSRVKIDSNGLLVANAFGMGGVGPVGRQTGGALTAAGTYGANEQSMLNKCYAAMQAFGFLT
jgi:hypothetical protein